MTHGFMRSAVHWALTALLISTLWACGGGDSETPPTEDVVEPDTQPDTKPESDVEDDVKQVPDVGDETDLVPPEDTGPCGPPECECNQDSDCTPIDSVCAETVCNLDTHSCESTPLEGVECDDDNLCTAFDQCNADGVCKGSSYSCQALSCQEAACNGKGSCDITTKAGYCAIEGACHVAGSTQADNACLVCDPTQISVAWTPTLNCTPPEPVCVDEAPCESNDDCPKNGECKPEGCDCPETANAGWCPGCMVDEVCYDPGVPNPNNTCQYCDVDENKFAWTAIPDCGQFTPCFTGQKCTTGAKCGAGNCVAGKCDCSDCNDNKGKKCTDDSICGTNGTCKGGKCQCSGLVSCAGCNVAGVCHPANTLNPDNSCLTCNPIKNTKGWTALATGAACNDGNNCTNGDACQGGQCESGAPVECHDDKSCTLDVCLGYDTQNAVCAHALIAGNCLIDGACVADGATHSEDNCKVCDPVADPYDWSEAPSCSGSTQCVQGSACAANEECGVILQSGQSGICVEGGCDCTSWCAPGAACQNEADCGVGGACEDATCQCGPGEECTGCLIDEQCYPAWVGHPTNSCKVCDATSNPYGWSWRPNGELCNADSNACTVEDSCEDGICQVGAPMNCNDGLACTADLCVATLTSLMACQHTPAQDWCVIDGVCYADGSVSADDECLSCDSANKPFGWTEDPNCTEPDCPEGETCDDGNACTLGDTCAGGVCVGGAATDCSDNLSCTQDACNPQSGQCQNVLNSGKCLIAGACYNNGQANPANDCEFCQSASHPNSWTARPTGISCDDGSDCTVNDYCQSGACTGVAYCPNPSGGLCVNPGCTPNPPGNPICNPVDPGWCYSGGNCTQSGDGNPQNSCQVCDPNTPGGWSPVANGTTCNIAGGSTCPGQCQGGSCQGATSSCPPDGLSCTYDDCVPGDHVCGDLMPNFCLINGTCVANGAPNPNNGCQVCDAGADSGGWSPGNGGNTCDTDSDGCTDQKCVNGSCTVVNHVYCPDTDGIPCTTENCVSGGGGSSYSCQSSQNMNFCLIGTDCWLVNSTNPDNYCQMCAPIFNPSGWTNKANGSGCSTGSLCGEACNNGSCEQVACSTGQSCTYNECLSGVYDCGDVKPGFCKIGGVCKSAGQKSSSGCRVCDPSQSVTSWTDVADGEDCMTDSNGCSIQKCDNGVCQLQADGECAGQEDNLTCTEDCVSTGDTTFECNVPKSGGCLIDGVCYINGDPNPDDPCEYCKHSENDTGWTQVDCTDSKECTEDLCEPKAGGGYECNNDVKPNWCLIQGQCIPGGEEHPMAGCMKCNPEVAQDIWSPKDDCESCPGIEDDECPVAAFCIDGQCMLDYEGEDMCDLCPAGDECLTGLNLCVAEIHCASISGSVECGEVSLDNPLLICGRGGFYPNCGGD